MLPSLVSGCQVVLVVSIARCSGSLAVGGRLRLELALRWAWAVCCCPAHMQLNRSYGGSTVGIKLKFPFTVDLS